jgi:hypothetical protein
MKKKLFLIFFFILLGLALFIGLFFFYFSKNSLSSYIPEQAVLYIYLKNKPLLKEESILQTLFSFINDSSLPLNNFQELGIVVFSEPNWQNINSLLIPSSEISNSSSTPIIILKKKGDFTLPNNYFKKQLGKNIFAFSKSKENLNYLNNIKPMNSSLPLDQSKGFIKIKGKIYPLSFKINQGKIKFQSTTKEKTKNNHYLDISLIQFISPKSNSLILLNIDDLNKPNLVYEENENFIAIYPTKEDLSTIEAKISSFLARQNPQKKEVILPDKTIAYELIADPNTFIFEDCFKLKTRCLKINDPLLEIGIGKEEDYLIVSNNLTIFEKFLENIHSPEQFLFFNNIQKETIDCLLPLENEPTIIWFNNINPLEYILINKTEELIKGCIIINSKS